MRKVNETNPTPTRKPDWLIVGIVVAVVLLTLHVEVALMCSSERLQSLAIVYAVPGHNVTPPPHISQFQV